MTELATGDPAPAFTLHNADGKEVSLSDYAGKKVIVYFYPAALTPGCTTQAVDFSESKEAFDAEGIDVVGISPDPVAKLDKFRSKNALSVELLSDPDREVIKAYGAWGMRSLYGKQVEGLLRSTFLVEVDSSGVGTIALAQYRVRATGHVARLQKKLGIGVDLD
ncbi:hypothetical protein HMPREF1531_01782 [Propionibacterium sp. oral taxon 192 str. F0372]|uniref:thioredoxin-dependent thiol peroxidase n=1 Tax=Propionibacterium sp. oral taxon 192 TaxID=671222 RepID=UPI0003534FB8|nr:thioredoxin-dependent thiol peroxidase [Propionibacterium sp. oral taxon 192]EPH02475.1 hypothetical protein HMPREF1531_01782 [Propionibacterium sp. oral taxon 192 str. F0372]